jgi:Mn2+/Fe2+ NRAMP family transporter
MWVSLHSSVIGTMGSWLLASHPSPHVVGAIVLAAVVILVVAGGYKTLERVQLLIVGLMLLSVMISLVLLNPDWLALLEGMFIPRALNYPDWLATAAPDIAKRPVWVETAVYVSVIGGASYDYLVYVSFLRDKRWGFAGSPVSSRETLDIVAADPNHPARRWVRAARFDTVASFVAIVVFSMVFVAMGAQILGPEHQIPNKDNMLNLQEQFLTTLHAGLWPLYVLGAGLTMVGTLYGTIEMSTYVAQEVLRAVDPHGLGSNLARIRRITIAWSVSGAFALLALNHVQENVNLIEFITPATLFTGLLSCGFVCLLAPWADRRFLPAALRMNRPLAALNGVSGLIFLGLGIKSYWDYAANPNQNAMVTATAVAGFVIAVVLAFAWGARLGLRYRQSH